MASATRVMLRVSRLPRTARRRTGMAGSPRLAAIRRMACSEEAQGSCPASRACRAASQPMMASGWPVVMVRRKASRCRKCPWLMISPAAATSAGMPLAASRSWQMSSGTGMAAAFMVMPPGRKRVAAGKAGGGSPAAGAGSYQVTRPARRAEGSRGGRLIGSRPARGAAADMRARPSREAAGSGAVAEVAVDLAGDIPLQAADDLPLRQALLGAPLDVGAGSRVGPHPGDHDPPQRLVGLAVAAAVEPVPAGDLAGGGRDRGDAAQVRP